MSARRLVTLRVPTTMPRLYNNTGVTSSTGRCRLDCLNSVQCSAQGGLGSQRRDLGRIPLRKTSHRRAKSAKYSKAETHPIASRSPGQSRSSSRVFKCRSVGSSSPHVQPAQDFTIWIQTLNQVNVLSRVYAGKPTLVLFLESSQSAGCVVIEDFAVRNNVALLHFSLVAMLSILILRTSISEVSRMVPIHVYVL